MCFTYAVTVWRSGGFSFVVPNTSFNLFFITLEQRAGIFIDLFIKTQKISFLGENSQLRAHFAYEIRGSFPVFMALLWISSAILSVSASHEAPPQFSTISPPFFLPWLNLAEFLISPDHSWASQTAQDKQNVQQEAPGNFGPL